MKQVFVFHWHSDGFGDGNMNQPPPVGYNDSFTGKVEEKKPNFTLLNLKL